ncbi:MAG: DUF3137 domain-containing protein [Pseudomonadota bacterium]
MSTPTSEEHDPIIPVDPAVARALEGLPADFDDFGRVFETEIRPALLEREGERAIAAERARRWTVGGGALAAVAAVFGFLVFSLPALAVVGIIAGVAVIAIGRAPLQQISSKAKSLIVDPIASQLNVSFEPKPAYPNTIDHARELGLVSRWDRSNFEDRILGGRNGVDYEFFEAHLEERRTTTDSNGRTRTTWVTVFKGQCLRLDFHKDFYGRTLVTRDAGFFNRFGGRKGMDRAKLEDPKFEKAFEVYTTDQVEARYILTPDFMQKLVDLEQTFRGKKLRCAFAGGEMLICVEGANLFEPGSMFTPLDNPERIRELLDDFSVLFHLIDTASSARARGDEARKND